MNKKLTAVIGTIGIVAGGVAGYIVSPDETITETITVEKPVETIVEKEVLVDNENLDEVIKFLYDNDGDVSYLTSDLSESELDQLVERILFTNDVKALALNATQSQFFEEIDRREYNNVEFDIEDLDRLRIDSEFDEIEVLDTDFEYDDARLRLSGTFEHDEVEYDFQTDVLVKDGQFEEFSNIQIN